jgi:hypothetical protein
MTRTRRIYSPWGCRRVLPEMDHLAIQHVYFFTHLEWKALYLSMRNAKLVLEDKTHRVGGARQAFHAYEERRKALLRSAIRRRIEEQILGRPMDEVESKLFIRKYTSSPSATRSSWPRSLRYLQMREDEQEEVLLLSARRGRAT